MNFDQALSVVTLMKKNEEAKRERQKNCDHDWKAKFEWVYDYQHYTCTKCKKEMMS